MVAGKSSVNIRDWHQNIFGTGTFLASRKTKVFIRNIPGKFYFVSFELSVLSFSWVFRVLHYLLSINPILGFSSTN